MSEQPPISSPQPEESSPTPAAGEHKRLHRSREHRMLFGVCGGLGEYFDVDPTLIRLIFVASIFLGGTGILISLVLLIIMPDKERLGSHPREAVRSTVDEVAGETRRAADSATGWVKGKLNRP